MSGQAATGTQPSSSRSSGSGVLRELTTALRSILERVAEFFDLFDLSFLVSGIMAILPAVLWPPALAHARAAIHSPGMRLLAFLVTAYVSGLVCFAAGRFLRMGWRGARRYGPFDANLITVLEAHGLRDVSPFADYLARQSVRGTWRLYIRLWAEARGRLQGSSSLALLNRYWVLAATYDGVSIALCAWIAFLVAWLRGVGFTTRLAPELAFPGMLSLLLAAVLCAREAGRFVDYQVEELVASIAAARAPH